jgi:hypothetical protein
MLGPIIVSLVGVSLPVVAGICLAPKRTGQRSELMLIRQGRDRLRLLVTAAQSKIQLKNLPAVLGSSSTLRTD